MILFLPIPLHFCNNVFARLPTNNFDDDYLSGKILMVSGWGSIDAVTNQQVIDDMQGTPYPTTMPKRLRFLSIPYLPNRICQKRLQPFFDAHPNLRGRKKDGSTGQYAIHINFEQETGSSMLCTSLCTKDELASCTNHNKPRGTCVGDSGGKCMKTYKSQFLTFCTIEKNYVVHLS